MSARGRPARVLIVDLNNFARYPTVAVGYLCAMLRSAGMHVDVFSPLSAGITGVVREPRVRPWGLLDQRLRYWSAVSGNSLVRSARRSLQKLNQPRLQRETEKVAAEFMQRLDNAQKPFDAVLISTYLMYDDLCRRMTAACTARRIPVLIGGPYFAQPEIIEEWITMPGLTALASGEVELQLPLIIDAMLDADLSHRRERLLKFPGLWVADADCSPRGSFAPPLQQLDELPFPDYSDFPWQAYPNTIVPLISGRGCGWGACTFCSDVTSTAGRTFRSRTPDRVLEEIAHQHQRYGANMFAFVDLKLNSSLDMWRAIIQGFQRAAPGAKWIASVHIGSKLPNGLSAEELLAAHAAGMVRLTTGLESGSQRILDRMAKGATVELTSQTLRYAAEAGISVRTTMIVGYPGETAEDVALTADYLHAHRDCIERVALNRLAVMTGTRLQRRLQAQPASLAGMTPLTIDHKHARIDHQYEPMTARKYRKAVSQLLRAVHEINRRPLRPSAAAFEGVM